MYIRTKNLIYEVESETCDKKGYFVGDYGVILKEQVTKEAKSIEELCDEFVGVDKTCENGHQLLRAVPYKCAKFWNGGVFGAIWTDKGLIYVAKMNDKGELELI